MNPVNVKSIQKEARQQARAARPKTVKIPKGGYKQHMRNPYEAKYANGDFRNHFYQEYSKGFIAWVYIRNVLLFLVPALLLHAPLLLIQTVYFFTFGEGLSNDAFIPHLTLIYGGAALLAFRRIHHQMAYYNVMATNGRRDINNTQANSNAYTPQGLQEMAVMDNTRMKLNKVHLFQSAKEAAIDAQVHGEYADTMANKQSEHFAAKAIADRKQQENGGVNEYDQMVRRYKNRTTPAMREIIQQVQQYN